MMRFIGSSALSPARRRSSPGPPGGGLSGHRRRHGGGAGGGTTGTGRRRRERRPFQPAGLRFEVAPRAEYTDWSSARPMSARRPTSAACASASAATSRPARRATPTRRRPSASPGRPTTARWRARSPGATRSRSGDLARGEPRLGVTWLTPAGPAQRRSATRGCTRSYVCGLTPAKTYYYRVGGGPAGSEVWSDVYSFTTTPSDPATEREDRRHRRLARRRTATPGSSSRSSSCLAGVAMQLFSGDIDQPRDRSGRVGEVARLRLEGRRTATCSTLGAGAHALGARQPRQPHEPLLRQPRPAAGAEDYPDYAELFYSVDVGPVHVVVIDDAFIVNPPGDAKYEAVLSAWLDADLDAANKNRAKVPWIVTCTTTRSSRRRPTARTGRAARAATSSCPSGTSTMSTSRSPATTTTTSVRKPRRRARRDSPTIVPDSKSGTVYLVCAGAGADAYSLRDELVHRDEPRLQVGRRDWPLQPAHRLEDAAHASRPTSSARTGRIRCSTRSLSPSEHAGGPRFRHHEVTGQGFGLRSSPAR